MFHIKGHSWYIPFDIVKGGTYFTIFPSSTVDKHVGMKYKIKKLKENLNLTLCML